MFDKSELENLLVKLSLGTMTIENVIEELENSFYITDDLEKNTIWEYLNCPFSRVIDALDKPLNYLEKAFKYFLANNISFICIHLDDEKITYLSSKVTKCVTIFDAGIIASVKENEHCDIRYSVNIFSTLPYEHKVIRELVEILNILNIECSFFHEQEDKLISSQLIKSQVSKSDCNIIAGNNIPLISAINMLSYKPVIVLPTNVMDYNINGILYSDINSGLSCALSVYRIIKK